MRVRAMPCAAHRRSSLTKKAEPPPTRDVNPVKVRGPTGLYARDSGTAMTNGGWLRRIVRRRRFRISHLAQSGDMSLSNHSVGMCVGLQPSPTPGQKWVGDCSRYRPSHKHGQCGKNNSPGRRRKYSSKSYPVSAPEGLR